MEGTVTISLSNYEELKEKATKSDHYFKMAYGHITLLEKIEEDLTIEEIETKLITSIQKTLEAWYG